MAFLFSPQSFTYFLQWYFSGGWVLVDGAIFLVIFIGAARTVFKDSSHGFSGRSAKGLAAGLGIALAMSLLFAEYKAGATLAVFGPLAALMVCGLLAFMVYSLLTSMLEEEFRDHKWIAGVIAGVAGLLPLLVFLAGGIGEGNSLGLTLGLIGELIQAVLLIGFVVFLVWLFTLLPLGSSGTGGGVEVGGGGGGAGGGGGGSSPPPGPGGGGSPSPLVPPAHPVPRLDDLLSNLKSLIEKYKLLVDRHVTLTNETLNAIRSRLAEDAGYEDIPGIEIPSEYPALLVEIRTTEDAILDIITQLIRDPSWVGTDHEREAGDLVLEFMTLLQKRRQTSEQYEEELRRILGE